MDVMTAGSSSETLRRTGLEGLIIDKVDVWAAPLIDRPGGLAEKLEALRAAGADLKFVIARRAPEKPGGGVVFVTPLQGDREVEAATNEGFSVTRSLQSLRVEGPDRAGVMAGLLRRVADEGISLQGLSAAVIGTRFVVYIGVDSRKDAQKVVDLLSAV